MPSTEKWRPSADITTLHQRAKLIAQVRRYFERESVVEVETPVLSHYSGTDVQLQQWQTREGMALHTSPEFAMKRLLAAGSGDIYQICRVFRQDELGKRHNPEFTMLEWYRLNMDEFALMDDIVSFIEFLTHNATLAVQQLTYAEAFANAGLPNPHLVELGALQTLTEQQLGAQTMQWSRDECLEALMALVVEPALPSDTLCFVYQFPASQAALAQHCVVDGITVARRFELFWQGMELANGYFELTDAIEQKDRFDRDCQIRKQQGLETPKQDEYLLAALTAGLPSCSGVALGIDRLMVILLGKSRIDEVIAFGFDRA